jgi:hypothetical protein
MSGWRNVGRLHTIPIDDSAEHSLCADCACGPTIEYPGNKADGDTVQHITHNAFDGRDFVEHEVEAKNKIRRLNERR